MLILTKDGREKRSTSYDRSTKVCSQQTNRGQHQQNDSKHTLSELQLQREQQMSYDPTSSHLEQKEMLSKSTSVDLARTNPHRRSHAPHLEAEDPEESFPVPYH